MLVFFQSSVNGDSTEQSDSPGESWQHHRAAQLGVQVLRVTLQRARGWLAKGGYSKQPANSESWP